METASTFNDDTYLLRENLRSLRTAFYVLFIGSILGIIPVLDIAGGVLILIGVILLIIGLGKIGNSNMVNAKYYLGTRNWLIINIVAGIAVSVVTIDIFFYHIISAINSSSISGNTAPIISSAIYNELFLIIGVSAAVVMAVYIIAYFKLAGTLKLLSSELAVPKLKSAGDYLKISIILSAITASIAVVSLYIVLHTLIVASSSTTVVSSFSYFSIFGTLGYTLVVAIVAFVFQLIAYNGVYSGLDQFFALADYKMQNIK